MNSLPPDSVRSNHNATGWVNAFSACEDFIQFQFHVRTGYRIYKREFKSRLEALCNENLRCGTGTPFYGLQIETKPDALFNGGGLSLSSVSTNASSGAFSSVLKHPTIILPAS